MVVVVVLKPPLGLVLWWRQWSWRCGGQVGGGGAGAGLAAGPGGVDLTKAGGSGAWWAVIR